MDSIGNGIVLVTARNRTTNDVHQVIARASSCHSMANTAKSEKMSSEEVFVRFLL